jgi:hypothetical protein
MRPFPVPLALATAAIFVLGTILVTSPALVHATDKAPAATPRPAPAAPAPVTPGATTPDTNKPAPRPRYADAIIPPLDFSDEAAALEAVHLALSELGDGASYVWHRRGGRLSGIINPTTSFKDREGRVCRHLVMTLSAGPHTARTEGVACRMADRSWRLEG